MSIFTVFIIMVQILASTVKVRRIGFKWDFNLFGLAAVYISIHKTTEVARRWVAKKPIKAARSLRILLKVIEISLEHSLRC